MGESGDGRYSTEELQLIVERAAALQHQSDAIGSPVQRDPNWLPTDEGMTLQSVKEIAAEVGLEPQFVEDAVRALRHETRHASSRSSILGSPIRYATSATFSGRATDAVRSELIDLLRHDSGHEGEVHEVLNAVEYSTVGRVTKTTVSIGASDAATEVQVRVDASGLAALTGLGAIGGGLLSGIAMLAVADPATAFGTVSILAAGGALGLGAARAAWSRIGRSLQARGEGLRDEVGRSLLR